MLATIAKLRLVLLSVMIPLLAATILATITKKPYLLDIAMLAFLFEGLLGLVILIGYRLYQCLSTNIFAFYMFAYALVFYSLYKTNKQK